MGNIELILVILFFFVKNIFFKESLYPTDVILHSCCKMSFEKFEVLSILSIHDSRPMAIAMAILSFKASLSTGCLSLSPSSPSPSSS